MRPMPGSGTESSPCLRSYAMCLSSAACPSRSPPLGADPEPGSPQTLGYVLARVHPAELHGEVLEGGGMEIGRVRGHGVGSEGGPEAVVKGLARRLLHADLGHRSRDDQRQDAPLSQKIREGRPVESPVAVLLHDEVATVRGEFVDDLRALELAAYVGVEAAVPFP